MSIRVLARALAVSSLGALCLACGMGGVDPAEVEATFALYEQEIQRLEAELNTCQDGGKAKSTGTTKAQATVVRPVASAAAPPTFTPPPITVDPFVEAAAIIEEVTNDLTGAAQLEILASRSVSIRVDGRHVTYNIMKSAYFMKEVEPGPHLVEVLNLARTVTWSETVTFPAGKRVRFQHKLGRKGLTSLGTVESSS
jgi:hypothetical protein